MRSIGFNKNFDYIPYHLLNKHTKQQEIPAFLKGLEENKNIGLFSEAGIPCVADPGAIVVKMAHQQNATIRPVSGPSSLLMALSASGFNGQNFAFNGYLPIDAKKRREKIKELEQRVFQENQTQLFIEAPYRNNALMEAFLATCRAETLLCVASNVTAPQEFIHTKSIPAWRKQKPDLHKKNTVFLLYK